jgi:hypothetical protein
MIEEKSFTHNNPANAENTLVATPIFFKKDAHILRKVPESFLDFFVTKNNYGDIK